MHRQSQEVTEQDISIKAGLAKVKEQRERARYMMIERNRTSEDKAKNCDILLS